MEEKIYMVSSSMKRTCAWAKKNGYTFSQIHVIYLWEQMMGLDGRNKVLHIMSGSYNLEDYSVILDYARSGGWAIKHVNY